jgi:hypothetical protein
LGLAEVVGVLCTRELYPSIVQLDECERERDLLICYCLIYIVILYCKSCNEKNNFEYAVQGTLSFVKLILPSQGM